jgi:hypothetical protein
MFATEGSRQNTLCAGHAAFWQTCEQYLATRQRAQRDKTVKGGACFLQ